MKGLALAIPLLASGPVFAAGRAALIYTPMFTETAAEPGIRKTIEDAHVSVLDDGQTHAAVVYVIGGTWNEEKLAQLRTALNVDYVFEYDELTNPETVVALQVATSAGIRKYFGTAAQLNELALRAIVELPAPISTPAAIPAATPGPGPAAPLAPAAATPTSTTTAAAQPEEGYPVGWSIMGEYSSQLGWGFGSTLRIPLDDKYSKAYTFIYLSAHTLFQSAGTDYSTDASIVETTFLFPAGFAARLNLGANASVFAEGGAALYAISSSASGTSTADGALFHFGLYFSAGSATNRFFAGLDVFGRSSAVEVWSAGWGF